jgi:hypothetical protein
MTRRCKNKCGVELLPAAKCTDILEMQGYCSKKCKSDLQNIKRKESAAKKAAKPKAKKKGFKSVRVSPADTAFSLCVRTAAKYTCGKCGKSEGRMECSHIFSRKYRAIRWCKENAMCKCNYCHRWWHQNPLDAAAWFISIVGESFVDLLKEKRDSKLKVPKTEEPEIAAHYRAELKKLENGAADFQSWQ